MRTIIVLSLATLLLFSSFSRILCEEEEEEDLSFLDEPDNDDTSTSLGHHHHDDGDGDGVEEDDEFDDFSGLEEDTEAIKEMEVDEKDVFVLNEKNFSEVVNNNRFVMVEFYATWCGHCQALAPEYAAAATELKDDGVILAKVDGTEDNELTKEYDVQGFPAFFFLIDGLPKPYKGQTTK